MKKGKKIWNRLLSLMLCLVMVTGMFAGMGMEAEAAGIYVVPGEETFYTSNGLGNYTWRLTPGTDNGTQFYDKVNSVIHNGNSYVTKYTYITQNQISGNVAYNYGFSWANECRNREITAGRYYVYAFCFDSINGPSEPEAPNIRHEYWIDVEIGYTLGVSISGASGSITANGEEYTGGTIEVAEGGSLSFSVKSVADYTPTVTFDGETLTASNGTYTISNSAMKNGTISVSYALTNPTNITITPNDHASITFNGSSESSQTVGKNGTYPISVTANERYIVTDILVDGTSVKSERAENLSIDWTPSNAQHTISANVREKGLVAKEGSIPFREGMNEEELANAIFNAIYSDESDFELTGVITERDLLSAAEYACIEYEQDNNYLKYMLTTSSFGGGSDYRAGFGDEDKDEEVVRLFYGSGFNYSDDPWAYQSNAVKLQLVKIQVEANGALEKVYDGKAMDFSDATTDNPHFTFKNTVGDVSRVEIAGHYDSSENPLDTAPTNAGKYFVKVRVTDSKGYNTSDFIKYEIKAKEIAATDVNVEVTGNYTYNKRPQNPQITVTYNGIPLTKGTDYELSYVNTNGGAGNITNAGTVTVNVKLVGNYSGSASTSFVINKSAATVTFPAELTKIYDNFGPEVNYNTTNTDTNKSVTIEYKKQSEEDSAYTTTAPTDAGDYIVRVSIAESANYLAVPAVTKEFSINQRELGISGLNVEKIYDGKAVAELTDVMGDESLTNIIAADENDVSVIWTDALITLDSKNVTATKATVTGLKLSGERAFNYCLPEEIEYAAAVKPRELTANVTVADKQYDGLTDAMISRAALNNVVPGETVGIDYADVKADFETVDVAENIKVTFSNNFKLTGADSGNYTLKQPESAVANIYNNYEAKQGVDYTVNSNDWINEDFVVTANEGYEISFSNDYNPEAEVSSWLTTLSATEDVTAGELKFYVRNKSNGAISKVVTEIYNIDTVEPTGTITIAGDSWTTFWNNLTWGVFFNKTQDVIISPNDERSGVAKVEYYESAKELTEAEVINLTDADWKEDDSVNVTLEDAKKFVYYARITDNAGNQFCINSDGRTYDITMPAITGVVNGETYYTTQVVNVSDANLKEAKLNGTSLTITDGVIEPISLEGNKDTDYTIAATDKAGNTITMNVTMKPVSSLSDQLAEVTTENVTSEDNELIDEIQKIIADENQSNATTTEKELLKELSDKCDALEKTVAEAKETVDNAKEKANAVIEGRITLEKEAEAAESKAALEKTLKENTNNLTEEEEKAIQQTIDDLDAVIEVIKKVKKTVKAVEAAKAAAGEYGVSDNEAAVSAYESAKAAYNRLTEEQKAMLGADVKKALDGVKEAITNYKILEGDGKAWVYNTNGTLTFVGNGLVRKLKNIIVDDEIFPMENCHISEGSTVVEVKASALYWLGLGDHTFQLEYTDGKTNVAEFSIVTAEEYAAMFGRSNGTNTTGTGAATGDSANILLWGAALGVGIAGVAVIAKKRRKNEEA